MRVFWFDTLPTHPFVKFQYSFMPYFSTTFGLYVPCNPPPPPPPLSLRISNKSLWGGYGKFSEPDNQKDSPDLGSDTSSVWNFDARSSDGISPGNQWLRGEMAAVYSGYTIIENYMVRKPNKEKALRNF